MADARRRIIVLSVVLVAAGVGGYLLLRPEPPAPIAGVVRATEIRLAPEVGGQLATIKAVKGTRVRAGDVVAELSALELTAAVAQAWAALDAATASRGHVYAGVRTEEIAALAAEIAKAKSKLDYMQAQLTRVATLPGRRKRSGSLPMPRCRPQPPRSLCSSGIWARPSCAPPSTASSA
jgi:HlyD family secretion protein